MASDRINVGWEQKSKRAPEPAISCLCGVEVFDRKYFHPGCGVWNSCRIFSEKTAAIAPIPIGPIFIKKQTAVEYLLEVPVATSLHDPGHSGGSNIARGGSGS